LKFGDIVTAVASLTVIVGLTMLPLYVVLAPTLGFFWGGTVVGVISTLVSSVIVGYIFAGKMLDGRREAIAVTIGVGSRRDNTGIPGHVPKRCYNICNRLHRALCWFDA